MTALATFTGAFGANRGLQNPGERAERAAHDHEVELALETEQALFALRVFEPYAGTIFEVRCVTVPNPTNATTIMMSAVDAKDAFLTDSQSGELLAIHSCHHGPFGIMPLYRFGDQFDIPGSRSTTLAELVRNPVMRATLIASELCEREELLAMITLNKEQERLLSLVAGPAATGVPSRECDRFLRDELKLTSVDQIFLVRGLTDQGLLLSHYDFSTASAEGKVTGDGALLITADGRWLAENLSRSCAAITVTAADC